MALRKEEIKTTKAPRIAHGAELVPVSQGIKAGNLIMLEADGRDLNGKVITDDFEKAARQTLQNVKSVLEAAGSSMKNIIRVDVYLQSMENYSKFNKIYAEFVPKPYPVRSVSQPARTPMDIPIGMVVTAVAD